MKRFDTPRMERINLVRQNIMAISGCTENYCYGYTCPDCEDHDDCLSQSPCNPFNCNPYACLTYVAP